MEETEVEWTSLESLVEQAIPKTASSIVLRIELKNQVIYEKAFGYLDEEKKVPTSVDTLFDLASLTKLFTTTAFLLLVQQKKVSIYQPSI